MSEEDELKVDDIERNLGKLLIDRDVLYDNARSVISKIMSKIIVLRCEYLAHVDQFEYVALCEDFNSVPVGEMIPYYDITISRNDNDVEVEFENTGDFVRW